jgi:hypothetical protein
VQDLNKVDLVPPLIKVEVDPMDMVEKQVLEEEIMEEVAVVIMVVVEVQEMVEVVEAQVITLGL